MKTLELTFEQVQILRDCLHEQIVNHYKLAEQTPITAISDSIHAGIAQLEDIDELLKY